jgi:MSHA biogenesis protein MshP
MKYFLNNQRGVSVILAIFMLLVLGVIMAALAGLLSNKAITSSEELLSTQALFLAETGVEIAINESLAIGTTNSYSYRNGTINVTVTSLGILDGQSILQIDSRGTIGSINRQVRVKYRL